MKRDIEITSLKNARQVVSQALASSDPDALRDVAWALHWAIFTRPKKSSRFLDFAIEAAFLPECVQHEGSSHLLWLFQFDWERLSEDQRRRLLRAIEANYASFTDWMSWFTISELLGEQYRNRAAFAVLARLRETDNAAARVFVPHAYEHLVSDSDDELLAREGYAAILDISQTDESAQVREEAQISLARLCGVGEDFARDPLHAELKWRDPWGTYRIGEVVEGLAVGEDPLGLFVEVRGEREWVAFDRLVGLDLSKGHPPFEEQLRPRVGQSLRLKVIGVDLWRGSVRLSERAAAEDGSVEVENRRS